ncbi:hypothetical protein [Phytomonospora endophytica]|uniref:PBP domain-containing protein n=1 Tax=Phytomonospora endophytica TaxID=714109 RepID=A0A841FAX8_9ACTN|nr:hypothetical protein [Phytomonospora endophytica]MBB6032445.1 hypothetical protein [Phytomonospora endophytica]GIG66408.1 hypothetical protein Pen01_27030 [Phytomonospora endophytica]
MRIRFPIARATRPSARPSSRRVFFGAVLLSAALGLGLAPLGPPGQAAHADEAADASELTVEAPAGGPFTGLKVTVSKTKGLTSEALTVTWTGGAPTRLGFEANYLQLMQCWGPDPNAADFRETCQYGYSASLLNTSLGLGGEDTDGRGRIERYGEDPAEPLPEGAQSVPFKAVTGERTPDGSANDPMVDGDGKPTSAHQTLAEFFNPFTTNEIPAARTTGDGTGRVIFEAQTAVEAPALGCGAVDGGRARGCWLVIVPRGNERVDGTPVPERTKLDGSPLQGGIFADRLVVPLEFSPIGAFCPLGAKEYRTVGSELVAEAVTSWQPKLCADSGPVFGYSTIGDALARSQVAGGNPGAPGMAFTADPVTAADGPKQVVHAPVTLSGTVIAFNIDAATENAADPDAKARYATAIKDLKLTPRLVAKLLTQSYPADVPGGNQGEAAHLAGNPRSLTNDPEFLELQPFFKHFHPLASQPFGLMTTIGDSASARAVWSWILADAEAAAWIGGRADPWGMKVNPNYRVTDPAAAASRGDYPKADPACHRANSKVPPPGYCTLDLRPYSTSMHKSAQLTLRGDALSKTFWDENKLPPAFVADAPRQPGRRYHLAITDAASAARYGLYTASLRNRAGEFVKPDGAGMIAAATAMRPTAASGVVATDPGVSTPGAYPLTSVTYAAVNKSLDRDSLKAYAAFIRHAAGPGQESGESAGQLPRGYTPLPAAFRDTAREAAEELEKVAVTAPTTGPGGAGGPPGRPGVPAGGGTPSGTPSGTVLPSTEAIGQSDATRAIVLGVIRFALVAALVLGGTGILAGPTIRRFAGRHRMTLDP